MSDPAGEPSAPPRLVRLPETDSTNAEAMRRALAGEAPPLWVLADRQTAGRGRAGRAWASQPGNLFASLLVSTSCPPALAGQLSLVAGVAAIDAIRRAAGQAPPAGLRLKWPNDILVGTAKTGGILVESTTRSSGAERLAIIGIGLNLVSAPDDLSRAATFLSAHGLSLSPTRALCFLAEAMDGWLKTWNDAQGFAPCPASLARPRRAARRAAYGPYGAGHCGRALCRAGRRGCVAGRRSLMGRSGDSTTGT